MKSPSVHRLHDDVAITGWACRLPGARSVDELWSLLVEGRCAITRVPEDRFSLDYFGHPRRQERGRSYSWAAGVLDDPWGFDPAVFGISPREAVQLDPQQRILLQLTWEALEDAGIRPSSLLGSDTGVWVGASQTDYGHALFGDPAVADAHFAPGTALAVLANRISYIYGLHGPSVTVDTACSSSLVALDHAVTALRMGRVDTAIVGGCNFLASPASFIAFSQANMLSPTGLCHAFSAAADGFVRAEGAVVLVLRKAAHAEAERNPVRGLVLATDVNSDGRKNGISLPNIDAQEALLRRTYERAGIASDRLAFVEAHGTGTPVGDPVEATAIGRVLGKDRRSPLPIGSIKSNIGHLEPGSGLAGVLKAVLALNHGLLPPSLHFSEPNPHIEFEELNLTVCTRSLLLPRAGRLLAGVNSFGFGGTNAHAIVGAGRAAPAVAGNPGGEALLLTADSRGALDEMARGCGERVARMADDETAALAAGIAHRRERMPNRLIVASTRSEDVAGALRAFRKGEQHPRLTTGTAVGSSLPVAFVYAGNGGQWVGMGRSAHRQNAAFRNRFEEIDAHYSAMAGWSLTEALFSDNLGERLPLTRVAQPLIFALQAASTAALLEAGLEPAAVFGHSVGEVAAAEAAGILDLRSAVRVIHARSTHQERVHGAGRMAAMLAPPEVVEDLVGEVEGVEIAAINSPRTVTVAGPAADLAALLRIAKKRGVASLDLDLEYPFHTALMDPVQTPLVADLADLRAHDAGVPFLSTVTGTCLPGPRLDPAYWWRNVREPVRFMDAVRAAADLGVRYFVEIGPRPTLLKHVTESLRGVVSGFAAHAVLDRLDETGDPFERARSRAIVTGALVDDDRMFGRDPGPGVALPRYPWQQRPYRFEPTAEALGYERWRHPFAGTRVRADGLVWRAHVDTAVLPQLADHRVGEQIYFPGTGFLEIGAAVAREWLQTDHVQLADFEIMAPLDITSGETREVITRVSPGSGTGEILSRPRLSQVSWLLHARFKMQTAEGHADGPSAPSGRGDVVSRAELYRIADGCGLHYGPAFRLVDEVVVHGRRWISVALTTPAEGADWTLDPMRMDAAAHGFFTLFPGLGAEERGVAYIPVRLDEVRILRSGVAPRRAVLEITTATERSIVGNAWIYGAHDQVVAVLRGVRSQPITLRRTSTVAGVGFVEVSRHVDGTAVGETGVAADAETLVGVARSLGYVADQAAAPADAEMLLEGWATVAACELAAPFAVEGVVDADALVTSGRLPAELRAWMERLLERLEDAGLARREGMVWTLLPDPLLPESASVVRALALEQQAHASETLVAAALSGAAGRLAAGGAVTSADDLVGRATRDFHHGSNADLGETSAALVALLDAAALWPEHRALRVLQVGFSPATHALAGREDVSLTVIEPDRRRWELAELALAGTRGVRLLGVERASELAAVDLIVSAAGLHRLTEELDLGRLRGLLAPGGRLVAFEPRPSLFGDLVGGLEPGGLPLDRDGRPAVRLLTPTSWATRLEAAGFDDVQARDARCGDVRGTLLVAAAPRSPVAPAVDATPAGDLDAEVAAPRRVLVVAPEGGSALSAALADALSGQAGSEVTCVGPSDYPDVAQDVVVHAAGGAAADDPVEALTRRCLDIRDCAGRADGSAGVLWLVFSGARAVGGDRVDPVEAGAWAFSRTLANEFPRLDVRRVDISIRREVPDAAREVARIVASETAETELHVGVDTVRGIRVRSLRTVLEAEAPRGAAAARLERRTSAGKRLAWTPIERRRPGPGEVEVEVEAVGLNFRDLMWSMSLLPEDMLEDGFSGASLGLECAGTVVWVGEDVRDHRVGDRVMAFAAAAFATHVTIEGSQAVTLPTSLSCLGAATVPVAFFTAYYSLVTLARLSRREWVMIHGGAGGVGMAAVQVAQARGARIIATAGSHAKRDLLRALGVEHVLDSRSTAFVDDVRRITKRGVDVVLNSLAGEAMERSLACLRPFGRFVELGKRDYAANTHVGLRPFRRNLSYFGVDVDQVIAARKALGTRVFARIVKEFENGRFTPLPHVVFDADSVGTAFHLMQTSGHVGKILVRPPTRAIPVTERRAFEVDPDGTHVVTGAFGGFGLETVKWLVEKGARHLVLIGRRGAATDEARALVRELTANGVRVLAEPCDVTDRRALEQLFATVHATMPAVVGVIHAAMVLDDGVLANLDDERFRRVLAPKILGAEHLDRMLRGAKLDYFVLFSSVTTLIGNPGQGNYVAANAYMEGLARRRRQRGQPALAIGWGPIIDVGVVAQDERLLEGLKKLTGVSGMTARDALGYMEQALACQTSSADTGVVTISPIEGSHAADRLAVLRSPTYADFAGSGGRSGDPDRETVDILALVDAVGVDAARRRVVDIVTRELSHVLHLREEDISQVRPLGEVGLDSLMALELVLKLEECFDMRAPLTGSAGGATIVDIADEIMAHAGVGTAEAGGASTAAVLAAQHHGELAEADLAALQDLVDDTVDRADAPLERSSGDERAVAP